MNLRPYWKKFLSTISKHFDIYIFTSATIGYASPIAKYLNEGRILIKGILHR